MPPEDLQAEVARLRVRLERERRARLEAEALAEQGTRSLYDHQQELRLVHAVTDAANTARSVEEAVQVALDSVCAFTTWPLGHAYFREDRRDEVLASTNLWHMAEPQRFQAVRAATEGLRYARGEGLPGRVLITRNCFWIEDVREASWLRRYEALRAANILSAFAFPVMVGDEVFAVLEFFSTERQGANATWQPLFERIGRQLSRTFERERAQAEMRRAMEAAEAGNRAKSEFLATMSHEIRTPMNGIIGFTNLLIETPLTPDQQEFARTIRGSSQALLDLINGILDFSKIEANRVEIDAQPYELRALLRSIIEFFSGEAVGKGLDLRLEVGAEVPERILGDPGRVRQVLVNLLGNAVKFTEEGFVHMQVGMLPPAGARRACIEIAVTDTGIGIPSDKQPLLFERFTQADASMTRRYGGTGLGLAISKRLVALMGGEMTFQSVDRRGSTFRFTLPAARPECSPAHPTHGSSQTAQLSSAVSAGPGAADGANPDVRKLGARVLLAEDNVVNQRLAVRILESLGCEVEVAANGRDAVEHFEHATFDCILMDCQMPDMDGFEATHRIRSTGGRGRTVPIVAVTANALVGDRERCLAAGMNDYITKPLRREDLQRVLRSVMTKQETQV